MMSAFEFAYNFLISERTLVRKISYIYRMLSNLIHIISFIGDSRKICPIKIF